MNAESDTPLENGLTTFNSWEMSEKRRSGSSSFVFGQGDEAVDLRVFLTPDETAPQGSIYVHDSNNHGKPLELNAKRQYSMRLASENCTIELNDWSGNVSIYIDHPSEARSSTNNTIPSAAVTEEQLTTFTAKVRNTKSCISIMEFSDMLAALLPRPRGSYFVDEGYELVVTSVDEFLNEMDKTIYEALPPLIHFIDARSCPSECLPDGICLLFSRLLEMYPISHPIVLSGFVVAKNRENLLPLLTQTPSFSGSQAQILFNLCHTGIGRSLEQAPPMDLPSFRSETTPPPSARLVTYNSQQSIEFVPQKEPAQVRRPRTSEHKTVPSSRRHVPAKVTTDRKPRTRRKTPVPSWTPVYGPSKSPSRLGQRQK